MQSSQRITRLRLLLCASALCGASSLALFGCEGRIGPSRVGSENIVGNQHGDGDNGGSGDGDSNGDGDNGGSGDGDNGGSGDGDGPPSCDMPYSAPSSLRRLTDLQYRNTVRDIFDQLIVPTIGLPESQPNLGSTGLTAEADANIVSAVGALRIADSAEEIGLLVTDHVATLLPCAADANTACAETFIDTYGPKAFRRPMSDDERKILTDLYSSIEADFTFPERIGVVASALVQMPQFLYVVEEGEPLESGPEGMRKLNGYEIASRLSYLFWDSTPDEALLAAAANGDLDSASGIETQARRLVDDERSVAPLRRFMREWIHLPEADTKDPAVYPEYTEELAAGFEQDLDSYLDLVIKDPDATPVTFLSSAEGNVNSVMADFFGMTGASDGPSNWQRVTFPPERAGLLTRPALMSGLAYPGDSAPIHRGKFVLTRLLCVELPSPPADALSRQPEVPVGASQRERSVARRGVQECAGCHDMIDPAGLGLEELDGIGRYRTKYPDGTNVENNGEIRALTDVQGSFKGASELTALLSRSDDVKSCAARQWMRYALSRMDTDDDGCSLDALERSFEESDYSLHEMFIAVTRTDAFRYRRIAAVEEEAP